MSEWVKHYNTMRLHSGLGGKPPAPETVKPRLELVTEIYHAEGIKKDTG